MRSAGVDVKGTQGGRASGEPGGRTGIVFSLNINFTAVEFISPCSCRCPHNNETEGFPGRRQKDRRINTNMGSGEQLQALARTQHKS